MAHDAVGSPSHYTFSEIQPIDVIEAWGLGFHLGNVVKYVARADHKGASLQDLRKAAWYLNREIQRRARHAKAVLQTIRSAGPMNVDELLDDLGRQKWIGELHEPPIDVDVPKTKQALIEELDRLGRQGLIRYGPKGWEPLYVPGLTSKPVERLLF
jgi:hypothetical protein